jgi:hypothetical protein
MVQRRLAYACCAAAVAAASLAGCAGPGGVSRSLGQGDEQALRTAVAKDPFPTANQLGIVAGKTPQSRNSTARR